MTRARRQGRFYAVAGLSLLLHAMVLAWLARPSPPDLVALGPDVALMSVELLRPVTPARTRAPEHHDLRSAAETPRASQPVQSAVAPIAAPAVAGSATPDAGPTLGAVSDTLRAALRASAGCSRSSTRQERTACEERLGKLSASTPSYDAPMDPGKRAYFDEVVAVGPSGKSLHDMPRGVSPGAAYVPVFKCSVKFGVGRKEPDTQGMVRLGKSPCYIPIQGSFFTPESGVHKR